MNLGRPSREAHHAAAHAVREDDQAPGNGISETPFTRCDWTTISCLPPARWKGSRRCVAVWARARATLPISSLFLVRAAHDTGHV